MDALWQQLWLCVEHLERELQESPDELCWQRARYTPPPEAPKLPGPTPPATQSPQDFARAVPAATKTSHSWQEEIRQCQACQLGQETTRIRAQAIVGYPPQPKAVRLFLVCDAPNATADRHNLPLPPDNLEYLQKWLAAIQMADSYYLTNLAKCRTPGGRAAWPEEIQSCAGHLQRQLAIFAPAAILALGSSAARQLSRQRSSLDTLRGQQLYYRFPERNIPLFVTYAVAEVLSHPAELRPLVWQDLQRLRRYLG